MITSIFKTSHAWSNTILLWIQSSHMNAMEMQGNVILLMTQLFSLNPQGGEYERQNIYQVWTQEGHS